MAICDTTIEALHSYFQSIKIYTDKLRFYDLHFDLIPYRFPGCNGDPFALFTMRSVTLLSNILQEERKHPFQLVRTITTEGQTYTFDLQPRRCNYAAFNKYVVAQFIETTGWHTAIPNKQARSLLTPLVTPAETVRKLLEELCPGAIGRLRTQMITVFHKGCVDLKQGQEFSSSRKRKFIELYLYAQGMIFARRLEGFEAGKLLHQKKDLTSPMEFRHAYSKSAL